MEKEEVFLVCRNEGYRVRVGLLGGGGKLFGEFLNLRVVESDIIGGEWLAEVKS